METFQRQRKMHTHETHKYQCMPKILQWIPKLLMVNQIVPFISGAKTMGTHSCSIQRVTANYKQCMGTPKCQSVYPVNVLGTPTCLSVYPINMGTHQYRLCTQPKIEILLLISKHELLVIHGYAQVMVRVPIECKGYTYLSVCVPSK